MAAIEGNCYSFLPLNGQFVGHVTAEIKLHVQAFTSHIVPAPHCCVVPASGPAGNTDCMKEAQPSAEFA